MSSQTACGSLALDQQLVAGAALDLGLRDLTRGEERVSEAHPADALEWMVRGKGIPVHREDAAEQLLRAGGVSAPLLDVGEVRERDADEVVLPAVDLVVDVRHSSEVGGGIVQTALVPGDDPELVERGGDARMDRAVDPLLGGERARQQDPRLVPALHPQERAGEHRLVQRQSPG